MKSLTGPIQYERSTTNMAQPEVPEGITHAHQYCSQLGITDANALLVVKIARNCSKLKLDADHSPRAVVAGIVMAVIRNRELKITVTDVLWVAMVSEVSINSMCRIILPFYDILIDDEATNHMVRR